MPASIKLLISVLGQEDSPRWPVWLPNAKQPVVVLRKVVQAKLFPRQKYSRKPKEHKIRFFFNGQELQDHFSIEAYDLQNGNVIQVKVDQSELNREFSEEPLEILQPEPEFQESLPQIESDQFYSIHNHIDALDDESGAWFPAQIVSIHQPNTSYLITYRKPSLGFKISRTLTQIRPQSHQPITFPDLNPGQSVLALVEKLWYVSVIEKTTRDYRYSKTISGKVWISVVRAGTTQILEQHVVKYKHGHILKLEQNVPKAERDSSLEEIIKNGSTFQKFYDPDCSSCFDDPNISSCTTCGCQICSSKDSPDKQLVCDECERSTHLWCLKVPLATLPKDPEWYCDQCRNETREELDKLRNVHLAARSTRHPVDGTATKWGFGMTCAGRSDSSKIPGTFGSIDGVPVGAWWRFRAQASECGVHAPLVSGIHGKESVGAYSVVFSGTYPEDVDLGDNLYYTASGGRDNSNAKRTNTNLVKNQKLTKANKALAMNCAVPFSNSGANAGPNWRDGKPVRVLRSGNGRAKSSNYLPKIGVRYDGLYKVVKYWPERSESGHVLWRFHLRRDDPAPAPWTEAGRYQARKNGFQTPVYPDGWIPELAGKRKLTVDLKYLEKAKIKKAKVKDSIALKPNIFTIPESIISLINQDYHNRKQWQDLLVLAKESGKETFMTKLSESFTCICCMDPLFQEPVTLQNCSHSFCSQCLARMIDETDLDHCPMCRSTPLNSVLVKSGKSCIFKINRILEQILVEFSKLK